MSDVPVTILMPVYNCREYVREAIDSILGQTFRDFEFLIIDDGSTDDTNEIIRKYSDDRIIIHKNEKNLGLIATLNKGLDLAKGRYIARMDGDDISVSNRFEQQFKFMESNPQVGLCGTWFETFSENKRVETTKYLTDDSDIRLKQLYQIHLSHGTCMFRTSVLKENNLYFDPEFIHAEDYELWTRIAMYTRFANVPQVLYKVRNNKNGVSEKYKNIQIQNTKKIIIKQFQKLKKDFNDEDYNLYLNFAYYNFNSFDKIKVKKLEELLILLFSENDKVSLLPVLKLKGYWTDNFFHLCYNVDGCMEIWKNSFLYDKGKMTFLKTIKKYITAKK